MLASALGPKLCRGDDRVDGPLGDIVHQAGDHEATGKVEATEPRGAYWSRSLSYSARSSSRHACWVDVRLQGGAVGGPSGIADQNLALHRSTHSPLPRPLPRLGPCVSSPRGRVTELMDEEGLAFDAPT